VCQTLQKIVSGFALHIPFLHDCWNDWIGQHGLGEAFAAAGSRSNSLTPGEDCLVLFAVAARLHGIDSNGTKHRICQGHSF